MTKKPDEIKNVEASVRSRLANLAKAHGRRQENREG